MLGGGAWRVGGLEPQLDIGPGGGAWPTGALGRWLKCAALGRPWMGQGGLSMPWSGQAAPLSLSLSVSATGPRPRARGGQAVHTSREIAESPTRTTRAPASTCTMTSAPGQSAHWSGLQSCRGWRDSTPCHTQGSDPIWVSTSVPECGLGKNPQPRLQLQENVDLGNHRGGNDL